MIQARDVVEGPLDAALEVLAPGRPVLAVGSDVPVATRIEAGLEEADQAAGDVDVVEQRVLDVVGREGGPALAHVFGVGAQQARLPPGEAGGAGLLDSRRVRTLASV